jgi:hypothetical protein
MRIKIIFSKNRWTFQEAQLRESSQAVSGPGRGWYQIHGFDISGAPELAKRSVSAKEQLVLVVIDIGACRDRAVTEEELSNVRAILEFFSGKKKDMILRFTYDREGRGMEHEPSSFAQVQQHMRQLGPVIAQYADHILTLQGLFVGSWGEMHTSRYVDERHLRQLSDLLWEVTEGACCLSVRKPVQWRMITSEEEAAGGADTKSVALYDDGMFASATHLGTFGEEDSQETNWKLPWSPQREYDFLDQYVSGLPNGGEAVSGGAFQAQEVLDVLQRMHICYLNSAYDSELLQQWKNTASPGRYPALSLYDEIGLRLGYRFVVERVQVKQAGASGEKARMCRIEIRIRNVGFGSLTKEAQLQLIVRHADGTQTELPVEADAEAWDSERTVTVTAEVAEDRLRYGDAGQTGDGTASKDQASDGKAQGVSRQISTLYLKLQRVCDGRAVRFANENGSDRVQLGTIEWKV